MCQRSRIRSAAWILIVLISWAAGAGSATAQPQLIGRSKEPIRGAKPEPRNDKVRAERFLIDPPTLENLGFRWYVSGDSNRNATVTVAFREQGTREWTAALPLLRVYHEIANQDYQPYRVGNLFAGSVLFLKPATSYEVKFTMSDPDGGAPAEPKVVRVATRSEPKLPAGKELHANSSAELVAAYAKARPGDVILLHAGVYNGPFQFRKSGEPGRPIAFRGAGDGEVILQGDGSSSKSRIVSTAGTDYLMFEDLTFRRAHMAIYAGKPGSVGITIRRCRIQDVVTGILTNSEKSQQWYIADNEIVGINKTWFPRPKAYMSPAHTGVNLYGRGHVVCYNRIRRFSDSLAIYNFGIPVDDVERHCVAIDFYGNDLSAAQDDTIETDYGCHNVRVYRNRCYNTHTALSTQPFYGGPVYLIRNEIYGITAHTFKLNNYPAGILAYNNTVCCAGQGFTPPAIWQNGHFRNNLFMGGSGYAMETGSATTYSTLDYNGYRRNSEVRFIKWIESNGKVGRYQSIKELHQATGLERHGLQVDYDIFAGTIPPKEGVTYSPSDYDLRLKHQANALDAGMSLPQVTDNFNGKAPDLGCYEHGQNLPHYGPRKLSN